MASTVQVRYVGRHPAVDIDPDGLGEVTVVSGGTLDVPVEVGADLVLQYENWQPVIKPVAFKEVSA